MSLPCRYAGDTIASSIALVMKQLGGKRLASTRASPLARYGWKHTRCRQTRIDGRRKALFRLDDIEDRAVNVDSLPMTLASRRHCFSSATPASPWRSNLHAAFSLSSSTSLSGCD
jgi:hypothetical protein